MELGLSEEEETNLPPLPRRPVTEVCTEVLDGRLGLDVESSFESN